MRKIYIILCVLLISSNLTFASTWNECIDKYSSAKKFQDNPELLYIYLKSTKTCLINFKNSLIKNPNPDFTIQAMSDNIEIIESNIKKIVPRYSHPKNELKSIPKYYNIDTQKYNQEYEYMKKYKSCNGVHANNKIYTAKHCNIKKAKNIRYDLVYVETKEKSNLKTARINLDKKGSFKYYSMSKEGMFFNTLLKEDNCKFYIAKNIPTAINTTLDLTDLTKSYEIRSTCLAIPSNSGGGVFQDGKLVGIISKTVFKNKEFLYSIVEPIVPAFETKIASNKVK